MPTAIVLSGGGSRGSFQVGALRYLYDAGVKPDILTACSVGSINALKLAEGEDARNRRQGLAGLESLWDSLRTNSDMYREESWLQNPKLDPRIRDAITGKSAELSISGPGDYSAWGDLAGIFGFFGGIAWLATDGKSILESLDVASQPGVRAIYNLGPIEERLRRDVDMNRIAAWASAGGRLRLALVGLRSGRLRYVTERGDLLERDGSPVLLPAGLPPACQAIADQIEGLEAEVAGLQAELDTASTTMKPAITRMIRSKQAERSKLQEDLDNCIQTTPPLPGVPARIPDIRPAVLASASIPGVFPPVLIAGEIYVDGGVREVLPVQAAVDLGADTVYSIVVSRPDAEPSYSSYNHLSSILGRLPDLMVGEIGLDDARPQLKGAAPTTFHIQPDIDIQPTTLIDPGLIQITRDYGYMRAADVVQRVAQNLPRWQSSTGIAQHRRRIWQLENRRFGQPNPLRPADPAPRPDPNLQTSIGREKAELRRVLQERLRQGGPLAPGAMRWTVLPERHPWLSMRLWHTLRPSIGGWSPAGAVRSQIGDQGPVTALASASAARGEVQFIYATADGRLWHTIRRSTGWAPAGDVKGQIGDQGAVIAVAAASSAPGEVQFVYVTVDGRLWHTTRQPTQWTPAVDVTARIGNRGHIIAVAAASSAAGELQVIYATADGGLWHTIRNASGAWSGAGDVKGQVGNQGPVVAVAATSSDPGEAQFVYATADGRFWHTIRRASGWDRAGDVKGQIGDQGPVVALAAASSARSEAQFIYATADGGLWHTIRRPTAWTPGGNVKGQIGDQGPVVALAAASSAPGETQFMYVATGT